MTPETLQARAATASYGYMLLSWGMDNVNCKEFDTMLDSYYEGFKDALKSERGRL